jgi:thiosulfate-binding protein SoxY
MSNTIGKTQVAVSSKVKLTAPSIAENGGAVPVTIEIDSPMTADDYIATVYLFVDHNPTPLTSQFTFTPACGQAYIQERIKMAKTDNVRVVAKPTKVNSWPQHRVKSKLLSAVAAVNSEKPQLYRGYHSCQRISVTQ